jgi:hypothetical protein
MNNPQPHRTIIEPFKIKMVEPLPMLSQSERERILKEVGHNLFTVSTVQIQRGIKRSLFLHEFDVTLRYSNQTPINDDSANGYPLRDDISNDHNTSTSIGARFR